MSFKLWDGVTDLFEGTGGFLADVVRGTSAIGQGNFQDAAGHFVNGFTEDLLGTAIGGTLTKSIEGTLGLLPSQITDPVMNQVVDPVLGAWGWTINELVDRPLGTYFTVVNAVKDGGVGAFYDASVWSKAWAVNDERTFGQSLMANLWLSDPFDDEEFNSLKSNNLFSLWSGTADFVQEFLDPVAIFGGTAIKGARGTAVGAKVTTTGEVVARYGRRTGNVKRLAPDRVYGPGMGVRPTTIGGRRGGRISQYLTKTDEQMLNRQKVINAFVDDRAQDFIQSDKWRRVSNAMQDGPTVEQRFRILKQELGRSSRHVEDRDWLRLANAQTVEARNLSMRALMGDTTASIEALDKARQLVAYQQAENWPELQRLRASAIVTGEVPIGTAPETVEALVAYDKLSKSVDWALIDQVDNALVTNAPRVMELGPDGYYQIAEAPRATFNTIDQSVALQAVEDLLGKVGPTTSAAPEIFSGFGNVAKLPHGSRINEIFRQHFKRLDNTTDDVVATRYVDANTVGGGNRFFEFITERVAQSKIYHHDSMSTNQFMRTLRDASRVRLPDNTFLLDANRVDALVAKYEAYRSAGQIENARRFFDDTVRTLNQECDAALEYSGVGGNAYKRHLNDAWENAQKENQAAWESKRQTATFLTDEDGFSNGTIFVDDVDGEKIRIASFRLSPSQIEQSSVIPRYDIVRKNLEIAAKREAKGRKLITDPLRATTRKGREALATPQQIWRSGVLLTPKWPMRITLEEQLRMAATLGAATTFLNIGQGIANMRRGYALHNLDYVNEVTDLQVLIKDMKAAVRDPSFNLDSVTNELAEQVKEYKLVRNMPDDVRARRTELMQQKIQFRNIENADVYDLYEMLGRDQFDDLIKERTKERILKARENRNLKRNAIVKGIAATALFANPLVGGIYGVVSYGRKSVRVTQALERKAAFNVSAAIRSEAEKLLQSSVRGTADYQVAMDLITEADYVSKLVENGSAKAGRAQNMLERADDLMEQAGFAGLEIGGQSIRSGFGDDPRFAAQIRAGNSANNYAGDLVMGARERIARELNQESADFVIKSYSEALDLKEFANGWEQTINRFSSASSNNSFYNIVWDNVPVQERVDALTDLLLKDDRVWQGIIDDLDPRFVPDEHVKQIASKIVDEYEGILPSSDFSSLRDTLRNGGKVTWDEVEQLMAPSKKQMDWSTQDFVDFMNSEHPAFGKVMIPESITAKPKVLSKVQTWTEDLFKMFGTLPSDELARHPFFNSVYTVDMRRRMAMTLDENGVSRVSQNQLNTIEREARELALKRTREVLYDLSEQTRISEVLGNASPFFNAWQEVLGRWGGFAVDNPVFVGRVYNYYQQPWEMQALGLSEVTVGEGDDEQTYLMWMPVGPAFDSEGNETTIFEAMPESVRNLFIPKAMQDGNAPMRMSKEGLNMITQGTPGFGPLVTVPVREAMYADPTLESSLDFMFPFGHPQGGFLSRLRQSLTPAWSNNAVNLFADTHTKEAMVNRNFRDLVVQLAENGTPIDWNDEELVMEVLAEAESRTNNFFAFRIAAGLLSPTSTTIISPYATLYQQYNDMEKEFGSFEAQARFLAEHGPDFFALTSRISKLKNGVAASVEADELYQQNRNLVDAHPDIGAWVTGSLGASDEAMTFSQAVYNKQFVDGTREIQDPIEMIAETQTSLGWMEYSKFMDAVRTFQDQAESVGLSRSLNSGHMAQIAAGKQRFVYELSQMNPAWFEEYEDFASSSRRINSVFDGFAAGLKHEDLLQRPSTPDLLAYLKFRSEIQLVLEDRAARGGSSNIENIENEDVLAVWEEQRDLIGARPQFSGIYDRYFARDKLLPNTFINPNDFPLMLASEY